MENKVCLEDLHPTYQQIARVIGIENTLKLGREFSGEQVYLPKLNNCISRERNRKIVEEFKGDNYEELAKKYGLTTFWIRKLVKKHRCKNVSKVG